MMELVDGVESAATPQVNPSTFIWSDKWLREGRIGCEERCVDCVSQEGIEMGA